MGFVAVATIAHAWPIAAACATATIPTVIYYYMTRHRRKINKLIARSTSLHAKQAYELSLVAAHEAFTVASEKLPYTELTEKALMHLAGVYAAQDRPSDALEHLDTALEMATERHGAESLALVPILHARAEVFEAAEDQPMALAASALARARDIRRTVLGENSLDAARASYNLASLLVRGSQESGLDAKRHASLIERAELLTLEACSVAVAGGEPEEGDDFAGEILQTLSEDPYGPEDKEFAPVEAAMMKLRDAYLEAAGVEWEAGAAADCEGS